MSDTALQTTQPLALQKPPSALSQLLSDPEKLREIDADKLEKLLNLQLQFEAAEDKRAYADAFNAVQGEMVPISRSGWNKHTKTHFARAEDLSVMLDPILVKHGFSWSISTTDSPMADMIRFVLTIRRGVHVETHSMDAPIDSVGTGGKATKTKLHGVASSYTYCERHLRLKVFGVQILPDDDGNEAANIGPGAEKLDNEQELSIKALCDETTTPYERFSELYGVKKISDIPRSVFDGAVNALERKRAAQESAKQESAT